MFSAKKWGFWSLVLKFNSLDLSAFSCSDLNKKRLKRHYFVFELRNFSTHNTKKRRTQHTCAQDTNTAECTKFCVNKVPLLRRGRDEKQSVLFNYEKRAVIRMLEPIKPLTGFSLSTRPRQVKRSQPVGFVSEFGTSEQRELIVKSRRSGGGRKQKRSVM